MKQIVKYRFMTIPNKLTGDIKITVDDNTRPESNYNYGDNTTTSLIILPTIAIEMMRPRETNENGRTFRPRGTYNDFLPLTKFNVPTFVNELKAVYDGMKSTNLYVYKGDRLDLNDTECEKVRRAFIINRTSIEFKPTVIEIPADAGHINRIEGIRMKFNNEDSTVLLTVREIESLIWMLDHLDVDAIVLNMYTNFITRKVYERHATVVDIQPVSRPIYKEEVPVAYTSIPEVPTSELPFGSSEVVDVTKEFTPEDPKEKPITQETVVSAPPEKYSLDNVKEEEEKKDDFALYMNPPMGLE